MGDRYWATRDKHDPDYDDEGGAVAVTLVRGDRPTKCKNSGQWWGGRWVADIEIGEFRKMTGINIRKGQCIEMSGDIDLHVSTKKGGQ